MEQKEIQECLQTKFSVQELLVPIQEIIARQTGTIKEIIDCNRELDLQDIYFLDDENREIRKIEQDLKFVYINSMSKKDLAFLFFHVCDAHVDMDHQWDDKYLIEHGVIDKFYEFRDSSIILFMETLSQERLNEIWGNEMEHVRKSKKE